MAAGCTNPAADNYDPAATSDDGSCEYTVSIEDTCYKFTDYPAENLLDKSFTASFAIESNNWVFFHNYIPDFYFHTREHLHHSKNSQVWTANAGPYGKYYNGTVQPFFIDIIFNFKDEQTLNVINWISEMISSDPQDQEFKTFTHITIWNNFQTSGRKAISQVFDGREVANLRRTKSQWTFNDFKDVITTRGTKFLKTIFEDFAINTGEINTNKSWFEAENLEDNYFIVRLEYDNIDNNNLILHEAEVDTTPSHR